MMPTVLIKINPQRNMMLTVPVKVTNLFLNMIHIPRLKLINLSQNMTHIVQVKQKNPHLNMKRKIIQNLPYHQLPRTKVET